MTSTSRVEAFSDGVIAIAITLLVLDLRAPAESEHSLAYGLAHQWPSYAAYVVSFLTIGVMWVNHHAMFTLIAGVDRTLIFLNLLLLLAIAALPFPTKLMADYLLAGGWDARTAALVYSVLCLAIGVAFSAIWRYVVGNPHLLESWVDLDIAQATVRRFGLGVVVYVAAIALSFLSAPLTLAVHLGIAIYYVFNQLPAGLTQPSRIRPE